jgi:hypothetical protein
MLYFPRASNDTRILRRKLPPKRTGKREISMGVVSKQAGTSRFGLEVRPLMMTARL